MKEFLKFTRGSGTSERLCLNSQCALLGKVSKLGWLLLVMPSPPIPSPTIQDHHHNSLKPNHPQCCYTLLFNAKCTSCSPLHCHVLVISETSVKRVHLEYRHLPWAALGPSRASLWTWQLQGTFLLWKVYLVISPNVLRWNILLSKLSWYKPVVGMQ